MIKNTLEELLAAGKPALADGAMGTLLHEKGVSFNKCFDELNLTKPSLVADIHHAYIEAGSQIILTNTFGANRYKLGRHGMLDQLEAVNTAGVDLARRVVLASFKEVLIAGDVGPLGIPLAPFGRVQPEDARKAFREQIEVLLNADVDLLVIETMTDLYEMREALAAARELSTDVPIVASMTFTRDDRTLLGDNPRKVARDLAEFGADVIGINCSGGPNQLLRILKEMRRAFPEGKYWVKPNAGWPEQSGGRIFYPATADYFSDYALSFWRAGASVMGGCCGTTPEHIAAMRQAKSVNPLMLFDEIDKLGMDHRGDPAAAMLEVLDPGDPFTREIAEHADVRHDLPRYRVWERGRLVAEPTDLAAYWRDDLVSFFIGCSFSFDDALVKAGVPVRHLEMGRNVPMYQTKLPNAKASRLGGPLVVSMRPLPPELIERAREVSGRFGGAHGAPVHAGDPAAIGIADLGHPEFGDAVEIKPGEVPVFWACGVTPQAALMDAKPPFAITHAPGHMFITDLKAEEIAGRGPCGH